MTVRARPKLLPEKRQKTNRFLLSLLGALVLLSAAFPARAGGLNEPVLERTYPADHHPLRSAAAVELLATFDRALRVDGSAFEVRDEAGTLFAGPVYLTEPLDPVGRERAIALRPPPLPEGPYRGIVSACPSPAGACAKAQFRFRIDNTPPLAPELSSPSTGEVLREQPALVRGVGERGARILVEESARIVASDLVNGEGLFSVALPYDPEDGVEHRIAVYAQDQAGNDGPARTVTFIHDSVTILPVITEPEDGAALPRSTVRIAGVAKPGSEVTVWEDDVQRAATVADGGGRWQANAELIEGEHSVFAYSFDGHVLDGPSNTVRFNVDLTAPAAPVVLQPAEHAVLASSEVTISGTSERGSVVRVRQGGSVRASAITTATGTWTMTVPFADGTHAVTAEAIDRAGNVGPQSPPRHFRVDTVPPAAPVLTAPENGSYIASSVVTVTGRSEPGASVEIREGAIVGVAVADAGGGWSASVPFGEGGHTITARARDDAGNASEPSVPVSFTVDTVAPGAPSIVSPPERATVPTSTVRLLGTAEPATAVAILEGDVQVGLAPVDRSGEWEALVRFANGSHTVTAQATDLAGNTSPHSAPRTFVVAAVGDTTPPDAPLISAPAPNSLQPALVVFRGFAEPGATVRVLEAGFELGSTTAGPGGRWELGEYQTSGSHTIRAVATDAAGNTSAPSEARTYRVDAVRPTVSITTPNPAIFLVPLQEILVAGTAADDVGVGGIELEIVERITNSSVSARPADECDGCGGRSAEWRAKPVLSPGIYAVEAFSIDLAGNRSLPARVTVVVL